MTYMSQTGVKFLSAFNASNYAIVSGVKVGIYNNGEFLRWLV